MHLYRWQLPSGLHQFCYLLMLLGTFGFHKPCCARTAWSRFDSNFYHYWNSHTLGDKLLSSLFKEILRKFHLAFPITVPPDYAVSVFRSRLNFLLSISFPVLTIRSRLEQNLPIICALAMYLSGSRRLLRDNLQCFGDLILCQLPIAKLYSFLLTYVWCHCQSFQNTLVLIKTSPVVGCLPSCRTSRRNINKHLRLSLFCFVTGSLLARWGVWRRTWVGQFVLSLTSWVDHLPSNQLSSCVCWDFLAIVADYVLVHKVESKIRCCSCHCCCCPGRRTKCCGYSRISAEPIYHSLVLEFYVGLVFHRVRLTNDLVEIISRLDVLKDCNFNFVDWS